MKKTDSVMNDKKPNKKGNRKSPVSVICSALGTALLIVLIAACIPFTLPRVMGYQAYTVVSGSMEPEIPVGSLVYVASMEPEDVQVRDVIAYYGGRDSNAMITHRVVDNQVVMGQFITKGDANQTNDMNPVAYENFIGTVTVSVPELGTVAQILTSKEGKAAAACVIGMAVVLHVISIILDKR